MSAIDTIRALVEAQEPNDAVTLVRYDLLRELLADIRRFTEQRYDKLERAARERDAAQERSLNRMMEVSVMKEKIEKMEAENTESQARLDEIVSAAQDLWRWAERRGAGQETSTEEYRVMMGRLGEALGLVE
jgi:chromosome segregation ATPase